MNANERIDKFDQAISDAFGIHGPWVLGAVLYDENGAESTVYLRSKDSSSYVDLGLADALHDVCKRYNAYIIGQSARRDE